MKVDIWFPLHIGDYLADTMDLTTEQHGAYFLLLQHYWRCGPLPTDPHLFGSVARLSGDAWENTWKVLERFFPEGPDGRRHNKRSDIELAIAAGKRKAKQEHAQKAANARWGRRMEVDTESNARAMLEHYASPSPSPLPPRSNSDEGTNPLSMSRQTSNVKASKTKVDRAQTLCVRAAECYQAYPRRVGRPTAIKAFVQAILLIADREKHSDQVAADWMLSKVKDFAISVAGSEKKWIPHPTTWVKNGRFDDDPKEWFATSREETFENGITKRPGTALERDARKKAASRAAAKSFGWSSPTDIARTDDGILSKSRLQ